MSGRRKFPSSFERRPIQSPGMMRHGPLPGFGPPPGHRSFEALPRPELLENKIAYQAAEIKQLTGDNHRLAATHVDLRQDLLAAEEEVQRLKAHMRSIQTESDIQMRALLDKIAKREADIEAGEGVKKELQKAHMEAQTLVAERQELTIQIRQATEELQKARLDVEKLPGLHAELDSLRREHHRLRSTFEYEKGLNIEEVEQMKAMEKNLIGMAREVERLRDEVSNAEKRAHAPNARAGGYTNPDSYYPANMQGGGVYFDSYGRPYVSTNVRPPGEGTIPYASSSGIAAGAVVPTAAAGAIWGAAYDPSLDTAAAGAAVSNAGLGSAPRGYDSTLSR
ncbi:protein FLX-like 4 isoform X1 [Prunus yedoensis var. nudiflora]|uniref:Protein FLX-like 4 isoform X1 n=1 Tax=Prunus yedoensis var. nudiflora TaxID=2094558 RepID=A0A314Z049_PRUYE|nr:protein FLX-like 4 isoform X1 [Prunus yedoensis var. nudiflora]